MRWVRYGLSAVAAAAIGVLVVGGALAAEGDELAQTISQNLTSLETQIAIAPENALISLERQKRQLDTLRTEAPEHPRIPALGERIQELEKQANAEVRAAAEAAAEEARSAPEGEIGPMEAPPELSKRLRKVDGLRDLADRQLLLGEIEEAKSYLGQAREEMDQLQAEFADRVPRGYAALIVADERLAALEDMVAAAEK